MNFPIVTKFNLSLVGAGLLTCALLFLWLDDSPILIESRESKTIAGKPVFNQIKRISAPDKTIWMMQQSHDGILAPAHQWERLAIVVDHKTKTAEYFQLPSGPFEWKENPPQEPLRVACFLCHANGPRVIRPNFSSQKAKISLKDRIRLALWNFSIKAAGRIHESPNEKIKDDTLRRGQIPFRFRGERENQPLTAKTCVLCHKENGFLARGTLTQQHFMAIRFLVENHMMPPAGIPISEEERRQIMLFIE